MVLLNKTEENFVYFVITFFRVPMILCNIISQQITTPPALQILCIYKYTYQVKHIDTLVMLSYDSVGNACLVFFQFSSDVSLEADGHTWSCSA